MGLKTYSTTATENTDVSGVAGTNIGEDNAPSTINNAIRQLMADMATDLLSGEFFVWETLGGALVAPVGLDAPFDGVTQSFTMTDLYSGSAVDVGTAAQVQLLLGGTRQQPDVDYSANGATLFFFEAPLAYDSFFAIATTGNLVSTTTPTDLLLLENGDGFMLVVPDPDPNSDDPNGEQDLGLLLLEIGN